MILNEVRVLHGPWGGGEGRGMSEIYLMKLIINRMDLSVR
jgi:hypothetical protein